MADRKRWPAWAIAAGKLLLVALIVWGLRRTILAALDELAGSAKEFHYGWLAASAALYLASLLPAAWFWRAALREVGHPAPWLATLRAYYLGHLGKYVPGKALVVVLRTGLLPRQAGDTAVVAATVFYETLTMMAVGAAVGAALVAAAFRDRLWLAGLAALVVPLLGLPTLPPVFCRLAKLVGLRRWDPAAVERLGRLRYRTLAAGWIALAGGWVVAGIGLYACLRGLGHDVELLARLPLYTAAVALATVAGFASLVPAGAVVREAVLLELLARPLALSPASALAAAVMLRLVGLVAEVAVSIILYWLPVASPRDTLSDTGSEPPVPST
jgi:uncharacterized membrane protein YbhN (UPF0104 family)